MSLINKLWIDLNELSGRPEMAATLPVSEIAEARARVAACAAALAVVEPAQAVPTPESERWLTPVEVEAAYPAIKRRFLFANPAICRSCVMYRAKCCW